MEQINILINFVLKNEYFIKENEIYYIHQNITTKSTRFKIIEKLKECGNCKYFLICILIKDGRTNKKYTLTRRCKKENIIFLTSIKGEKIND